MSIEREFEMIEFDNGIFHTEQFGDSVNVIETKTGERICSVCKQSELDWTIDNLMRRRLVETGGRLWV